VPVLTVFAGPNGSGKSSIIRLVDFEGRENLLEADAIAKRLHPCTPRLAAVAAGREVLRRTNEYIQSGQNFAIETTLAGAWTSKAIQAALSREFFVRLVYICVDNPERSIQRVHERVAQGGHDVPDDDVRRRYARSLLNVTKIVATVNQAIIYDNSGAEPKLLLEFRGGVLVRKSFEIPSWARNISGL
jgi:predicted ABC-type ATPase